MVLPLMNANGSINNNHNSGKKILIHTYPNEQDEIMHGIGLRLSSLPQKSISSLSQSLDIEVITNIRSNINYNKSRKRRMNSNSINNTNSMGSTNIQTSNHAAEKAIIGSCKKSAFLAKKQRNVGLNIFCL
jgi:hypothetical protein